MRVVAFAPDYDKEHQRVLSALCKGIPGAKVGRLGHYEDCDVAIVYGGVKRVHKPSHAKQEIFDRHQGRRLLMVESGFIRRREYYAVGWGGQAGHADFNNNGVPLDRWLGMAPIVYDWQRNPDGPVIVCGQLPRDVQVQDVDHVGWCRQTVGALEAMGQQVIFRPHPKCVAERFDYGVPCHIDTMPIADSLKARKPKAVVTYNSTSCVDALIHGIPVIAQDSGSIAWAIAQHDLSDLKALAYPRRDEWFAGIGYALWTLPEMEAGLPWRHLNAIRPA